MADKPDLKEYVGVVYSELENKVYCWENSYTHKVKLAGRTDLKIAYLPYSEIHKLFIQNPSVDQWNVSTVLELEKRLSQEKK